MESRHASSDSWLRTLGAQYGNYRRPPNAFGMTTNNELQMLETYARERFAGRGGIVDLGCWYGATTLSLARGLAANPRELAHRRIDAFDLFVWDRWMDPLAEQTSLPKRYTQGEDFFADVQALMEPYAGLVALHQQDLSLYAPPPTPIEFLFVDAMKDWRLAEQIVTGFFPALIAGESYVVQQDFAWYLPEMATNHLLMWQLRDALPFVHHVPGSASVVFKSIRPIAPSELPDFRPEAFSVTEIEEAYAYSRRCVGADMAIMIEIAQLNFLIEQGHADAASAQLGRLAPQRRHLLPAMLGDLNRVADQATAAGRLSREARQVIARGLATLQ